MRHAPGELIDHYEVISALGEGAYAETYKATDTATGETVVLKMPNPNLFADPGLFQRYRREAEIARQLDHPGVQRGRDGGKSRTEPYLVLEYVDGDNLRRVMRERAPTGGLPIATVLDWGRQLAESLAYLHRLGIVHRDLKPENVLVTGDDRLKIADFGTAMLEGARRLTWRVLSDSLGTPDYMSPEQCQGERGDARSDVYAWGIMMYELLSGQVPFRGDNWLAVMAGHLGADPRPLRAVRPDVPPALEAIVMHAMRRHPENRYQSADELVADLRRVRLDPAAPAGDGPGNTAPGPPRPGAASSDPPRSGAPRSAPRSGAPRSGRDERARGAPDTAGTRDGASSAAARAGAGGPGGDVREYGQGAPSYVPRTFGSSAEVPSYDTAPERPMGHMAAVNSEKRLWALVALIAVGFLGIVTVIITLSVVLR